MLPGEKCITTYSISSLYVPQFRDPPPSRLSIAFTPLSQNAHIITCVTHRNVYLVNVVIENTFYQNPIVFQIHAFLGLHDQYRHVIHPGALHENHRHRALHDVLQSLRLHCHSLKHSHYTTCKVANINQVFGAYRPSSRFRLLFLSSRSSSENLFPRSWGRSLRGPRFNFWPSLLGATFRFPPLADSVPF